MSEYVHTTSKSETGSEKDEGEDEEKETVILDPDFYPPSASSKAVSSYLNFHGSVVGFYYPRRMELKNGATLPALTNVEEIALGTQSNEMPSSVSGTINEQLIAYFVARAIEFESQNRPPEYCDGLRLSDFGCNIITQCPNTNMWNTKRSRMLLCFGSMSDIISMDAFNEIVGYQSRCMSSRKIHAPLFYTPLASTSLRWAFKRSGQVYTTEFNVVMGLDVDLVIGWRSMRKLELYRAVPLLAWRMCAP
ncbi:hypothetical protein BO82DRAFT_369356 [Aspergillus uvarum CBS 121591]|uniref:Uncharacterized protein n=1 Tax=Aspergillus uvarum CBS 121591 TaxID=1448315 RepID=A0A319CCN1_9EURO|nr:hypothetical protein BO82DRAFT_369356 [Aspergillus uvarum CBS 121591]PYH76403.1 hypothetical protein BO82DRAFT_369356 [Aspergillus uvarum CBS 121591]